MGTFGPEVRGGFNKSVGSESELFYHEEQKTRNGLKSLASTVVASLRTKKNLIRGRLNGRGKPVLFGDQWKQFDLINKRNVKKDQTERVPRKPYIDPMGSELYILATGRNYSRDNAAASPCGKLIGKTDTQGIQQRTGRSEYPSGGEWRNERLGEKGGG